MASSLMMPLVSFITFKKSLSLESSSIRALSLFRHSVNSESLIWAMDS